MKSLIAVAIIAIILQGIIALSTYSSFKNQTIVHNDVQKVMKNLIIFTVVICIFYDIYNIFSVNKAIDKGNKK